MDLVIDIGNSQVKGGLFEEKKLMASFSLPAYPLPKDQLAFYLDGKQIESTLIATVNAKAEEPIKSYLQQQKISFRFLNYKELKLVLDVDEPAALGQDRIANAYGALVHFPTYDCIVVDIGTSITLDFVEKEGRYTGGMIYPGAVLCAAALHQYTDKLPLVSPQKPPSARARTTETHLQSGIFYGQLGAIERMIDELKATSSSPMGIKVIATGGATQIDDTGVCFDKVAWVDNLRELVDFIDPHLTLIGLREILYELKK